MNYVSLFISLAALAVSIFVYLQTADHNEKELRPAIEFRYKFGIGSDKGDGGYLALKNVGQGAGKLTGISATFDGSSINTDSLSLKQIVPIPGISSLDLSEGSLIGAGESLYIYKIKPDVTKSDICKRDKQRKAFFEKLKLQVEYESLHNYQQKAEFKYQSTNNFNC